MIIVFISIKMHLLNFKKKIGKKQTAAKATNKLSKIAFELLQHFY